MIGTVLSGRYKLEAKLGSGGMSTVYLARDTTLDRAVAVKVMHREMSEQADQLERFRQEARAVAKISHPNVVAVIDAGEDGGHPYIVFEYVEGETLKQRIARVGALDAQEALAYAIEIARGLTVAHARNMVHRDIKPQNVLIDAEGRAKLTDFGISRQLEQDGMTATGRVLGTTDYVSPEQAMGHSVDQRSDIYSLGVVLYEMLTGQVPFQRRQPGRGGDETRQRGAARRPAAAARALRRGGDGGRAGHREGPGPALPAGRRDDRRPGDRARGRGGAGGLDHRRGDERARGGAAGRSASSPAAVAGRALWLALLLLAFAGAVAAVILISSGNGPGGGGGALDSKGTPLALAEASDYDPQGDDEEDPEAVSLAIDGNPTGTAWTSEHYDDTEFAGTKSGPNPGVGLYVATKTTATPKEMIIRGTPGWDAEIYAAPAGPPEELSEWGEPVGEVEDAGELEEVELHLGSPAKYFLIWFTKAAPSRDQEGRYRIEISDVKVID